MTVSSLVFPSGEKGRNFLTSQEDWRMSSPHPVVYNRMVSLGSEQRPRNLPSWSTEGWGGGWLGEEGRLDPLSPAPSLAGFPPSVPGPSLRMEEGLMELIWNCRESF